MRERPHRYYNQENCITNCVWCCLPSIIFLECIFKFCSIFSCSNTKESKRKVRDNKKK